LQGGVTKGKKPKKRKRNGREHTSILCPRVKMTPDNINVNERILFTNNILRKEKKT